MDSVEIVIMFEEHFEIEISDAEAEALFTIGQTRDLICKKLLENGHRATPEVILKEVINLTADFMSVDATSMTVDTRFIEDLRID